MPIDIYQSITDKIVAQLENSTDLGQWSCPWHKISNDLPRSADGRLYRGVNILTLWCSAIENGRTSPVWATYKQWLKHGCQVRRGEKSEMVVFWKRLTRHNYETGDDEDQLVARAFFVFNSQQVDGYKPPTALVELDATERDIQAEDYFVNVGADVRIGGDRAFYSPSSDFIGMPSFNQFKSGHDWYSTLSHEHIHWTGASSRLDRELSTARFGNEAYAFEELVAELGAAFVCAQLGLENEPRTDHAKYLNAWLKVLRSDKKAIFTAASKAQKAADYLAAYQPDSGLTAAFQSDSELMNSNEEVVDD